MLESLIYDWNKIGAPAKPPRVMLDDETLRDGLQSPSVRTPTIEQKIEILHLIDALGIDTADIGLPGAGPHVVHDVERLAREIVERQAEGARQLRRAHDHQRHRADRRDHAAHRPADRGRHVHRLVADPPVHRGLDARLPAASTEEAISFAVTEGLDGDVRHRRHHARRSGDAARALRVRDPSRRQAHLRRRHRRSRHAVGRRRRWSGSPSR